jgi:RND family efflux transporter MFP subunit
MKNTLPCVAAVMLATTLSGCRAASDSEEASAPVALVELQPVTRANMSETLSAYGTTEFAAAGTANLAVQLESRVDRLLVTAGTPVRKGQDLLILTPTAATRLDLDKARRDALAAAVERERLQRLRADGLATASELQLAVSNAVNATALRDSLASRAGAGARLHVRAPFAGVVDALTAQPGDVLAAGAVAVRIAAPDALQVRLGLDPTDARRIAVGAPVRLQSLTAGDAPVVAAIASLDRRIDPQSGRVAALVRLPRKSALLAGAPVKADITVAQHANALVVPRAALLYDGAKPYVYTARNHKAFRHDVRAGIETAEQAEILQGLADSDLIVVAGNAELQEGMALRTGVAAAPEIHESTP